MLVFHAAIFSRSLILTASQYVLAAGIYLAFLSVVWLTKLRKLRFGLRIHLLVYGSTFAVLAFVLTLLYFVTILGPNL